MHRSLPPDASGGGSVAVDPLSRSNHRRRPGGDKPMRRRSMPRVVGKAIKKAVKDVAVKGGRLGSSSSAASVVGEGSSSDRRAGSFSLGESTRSMLSDFGGADAESLDDSLERRGGLGRDQGGLPGKNGGWNMAACIDAVESMLTTSDIASSLTPEQRAAIENLRSASAEVEAARRDSLVSMPSGRSHRGSKRREAKFFGVSRFWPMSDELKKRFREMEDQKMDQSLCLNVGSVLENYGGDVLRGTYNLKKESITPTPSRPSRGPGMARARGSVNLKYSRSSSLDWDDDRQGRRASFETEPSIRRQSQRRSATVEITPLEISGSLSKYDYDDDQPPGERPIYCPPEWNALTKGARTELTTMLSWERLSRWDFDVREVARLSKELLRSGSFPDTIDRPACPLLLVGWAILCEPHAQRAMEGSLGDHMTSDDDDDSDKGNGNGIDNVNGDDNGNGNDDDNDNEDGGEKPSPYSFDVLNIDPEKVCNFLREIEKRYVHDVPYHNNVHAADVTQTLHCLLQFLGKDLLQSIYDPLEVFSMLLAATFHDVAHPGTNNLFQKHSCSKHAMRYNDVSILENMHCAVGHSYLMGEDRKKEWDVFQEWSKEMKVRAREVMVEAILSTDMSHHFAHVGELTSLAEKVGTDAGKDESAPKPILRILSDALDRLKKGEEVPSKKHCLKLKDFLLKFLLHCADISNPAKPRQLCIPWADRALAEFFAQGDEEERRGLPISPMCDRATTARADSQIGFLKFVIRPTYLVLGEIVPRVGSDLIPIVDGNIAYWSGEKSRLTLAGRASNLTVEDMREGIQEEGSGDEDDDENVDSGDEIDDLTPSCPSENGGSAASGE